MYRCGDFRKFFAVALALGVVANAGGKPALAKARYLADAARPTAIHECNIEADKYSPITQLPNQFAVYGTSVSAHGPWPPFGRPLGFLSGFVTFTVGGLVLGALYGIAWDFWSKRLS